MIYIHIYMSACVIRMAYEGTWSSSRQAVVDLRSDHMADVEYLCSGISIHNYT